MAGKTLLMLAIVLIATGAAADVGWSEMVPTRKAAIFSAGYYYSRPYDEWKQHPYAPVDLFGSGHGARFAAGIQADWFRGGGVVHIRYVSNSEWESSVSDVDATSYFYNIGWFAAANPWYSRRISPIIGLEMGFFIPDAEETSTGSSGHKAKYNFLAPDGFSDYVAPFIAGVFHLNNNFSLMPLIGYHSAQPSEKHSGENSRLNWIYFGLSIESRIPLTLF